jgi:hypothetical protein
MHFEPDFTLLFLFLLLKQRIYNKLTKSIENLNLLVSYKKIRTVSMPTCLCIKWYVERSSNPASYLGGLGSKSWPEYQLP